MENFGELRITGYDKKPIKNTLTYLDKPSGKIAIVFPGIGYTCQMPLLYHTTNVMVQHGYDVLWVEYQYGEVWHGMVEEKRLEMVGFDAEAALSAAMSHQKYKDIVLVGKSLGSYALAALNKTHGIKKSVGLTPLLERKLIYPIMDQKAGAGLFIIGSIDPEYSQERLDALKKNGGKVLVIPDADHSIEIHTAGLRGDVHKSIEVLAKVVKEVDSFID